MDAMHFTYSLLLLRPACLLGGSKRLSVLNPRKSMLKFTNSLSMLKLFLCTAPDSALDPSINKQKIKKNQRKYTCKANRHDLFKISAVPMLLWNHDLFETYT
jgi:hypothetical protein